MRGIVCVLLAAGLAGCAGTPVLPAVDAGASPAARETPHALPREPEPAWRVAPTAQGAALELRF